MFNQEHLLLQHLRLPVLHVRLLVGDADRDRISGARHLPRPFGDPRTGYGAAPRFGELVDHLEQADGGDPGNDGVRVGVDPVVEGVERPIGGEAEDEIRGRPRSLGHPGVVLNPGRRGVGGRRRLHRDLQQAENDETRDRAGP